MRKELAPKTAVDLVGGRATADLFNTLVAGGKVHIAGYMSLRPISGIDDRAMRYEDKQIVGFYLYGEWDALASAQRQEMLQQLQSRYRASMISDIAGEYPLDSFEKAMADYKTSMSTGKRVLSMA